MPNYDGFQEARIKHLELIQAVIARLGNNSFLMKGWALTVAGVFFGFAVDSENWQLALASILPTVTFWGLDAYFLRCERLFRVLYDRVRTGDDALAPFFMAATGAEFVKNAPADVSAVGKTFWRPTLRYFYGAIIGAAGLVILIVLLGGDPGQPASLSSPGH